MPMSQEHSQALEAARVAMLNEAQRAAGASDASRMLAAAEAYAWLQSPNQSHGGGVKPPS